MAPATDALRFEIKTDNMRLLIRLPGLNLGSSEKPHVVRASAWSEARKRWHYTLMREIPDEEKADPEQLILKERAQPGRGPCSFDNHAGRFSYVRTQESHPDHPQTTTVAWVPTIQTLRRGGWILQPVYRPLQDTSDMHLKCAVGVVLQIAFDYYRTSVKIEGEWITVEDGAVLFGTLEPILRELYL